MGETTVSNPLLRRAEAPSADAPNPYECLGLKQNPFPAQPALVPRSEDPRLNGQIYSTELHRNHQEEFDRILVPTRERQEPLPVAFLMDHAARRGRGIGKSAFLAHQARRIMQDFGSAASEATSVIFAAHVVPPASPPCRKFWQFCEAIVDTLSDQGVIAQAMWRLRGLCGKIPAAVLERIGDAAHWAETIGNDRWLEQNGVGVQFDLTRHVKTVLQTSGVSEDMALILAEHGASSQGLRYELSREFTDYRWRRDGGRLLFHDLVNFFGAAEFTRGLLLIDEVEKIVFHQNTEERRAFVESLRYYTMDGDCANARARFYGILLTIHPIVQELLLPYWSSAGLDRLVSLAEPGAQHCTVYFPPLDSGMAEPLVTVYLDHYRLDPSYKGTIEPFEREAVIEALVKSGGVPGRTLSLLNRVVDKAAEQKATRISKQFVEEAWAMRERREATEIEESDPLPRSRVQLTERENES